MTSVLIWQAGFLQPWEKIRKAASRDGLGHQQGLHGVAGGRALDLGVQADGLGHGWIRIGVHVDMADPLIVLDHGYRGLLPDRLHQGLAAAGNDQVHELILFEEGPGDVPIRSVHKGDRAGGHARLLGRFGEQRRDGAVRVDGLRSASQNTGIAGLQA